MLHLRPNAVRRCARRLRVAAPILLGLVVLCGPVGCGPTVVDDPLLELQTKPNSPRRHLTSMTLLDAAGPDEAAYLETLHRVIWAAGYTIEVREAALERLDQRDPEGLQRTIRQHLPRMAAWRWRERLSAIIAERGWTDLTPALISSWATRLPGTDDADRAERRALIALHGDDQVVDVVFVEMLRADEPWQAGFRHRCWALLHRLGHRDRLLALIAAADIARDDGMLLDLRAAADDLGIVPHNREEILWVRELRKPERAEFWSQAVGALAALPPARRDELELRDVPVVVAARHHRPDMLEASAATLADRLEARLDGAHHVAAARRIDGPNPRASQRFARMRGELGWGDLLAMHMALDALEVPEVVDHLLDYAERDRADVTTEYGGVLELDERGRFVVHEHPPRIREHDQKFVASQEMFDAAYDALFHFHYHVQRVRNDDYAGPGLGDQRYADATRANCLVLTSVGAGRLNVDFYRHGGMVVDLGTVGG